jgi:hypothetical protein
MVKSCIHIARVAGPIPPTPTEVKDVIINLKGRLEITKAHKFKS